MIPQAAVNAYLKASKDDHRWLKTADIREIEGALATLVPEPTLSPGLRHHQKIGFLLGTAYPRFAFFYDMGVGKTLLALELLRYWWDCKRLSRAIILVKSDKAFPTWTKQIKLWDIDIPYLTLGNSSTRDKWAALEGFEKGLILLTYPGLVRMVSEYIRTPDGGGKLRLDQKFLQRLAEGVQGVILDESTCCGEISSLTSKACLGLRKRTEFFYALAGRPFGRDPTMLWSQMYVLDGGQTLGGTLGLFREAFFTAEANPWDDKGYAQDYTFNKKMMPQLTRMMQHRSLTYAAAECIDVPAFQSIIEEVSLPEEAGAYYHKVVQQVIGAKGNLQEMKNAFIRMRQLSSGFLGFRNDETGARVEIEFTENPKLDRLLELLDELPNGRKAVVFYDYTHSGKIISSRINAKSIVKNERKCIWLWSGTKDAAGALRLFQEDPEYTIAVINSRIGAYSLDGLQDVANYLFFFESPVSNLDREQAEHRIKRQGQKSKVFMYDLCVKGTLDFKILEFHKEGADLLAALRADPGSLLKQGG